MTMSPARAALLRVALLGAALSLTLVGCSGDSTPGPAGSTPPSEGSASVSPSTNGSSEPTGDATGSAASTGPEEASGSSTSSPDPTVPESEDDATSSGGGDVVSPESELLMAPEPSPTPLSELVTEQSTAPLVRTPLPLAANALGRLVGRFPEALRPPPRSAVESSSISPSGERLQVALVGSTSLSPEAVMRSYRVRLAKRGLAETAAPATVGGSQSVAFRRGASRITVTVTDEGPRTSYAVSAVLHAGRA